MPQFSRRRIQSWINDLTPLIDSTKARDFIARIEDKRADQSLPAEMELAVLWSLSRLGDVEIEPEWFSPTGQKIEAVTDSLFPGKSAAVEVFAPSDDSLPGEEGMRNASEKIRNLAGSIKRGMGNRLSFYFHEESLWSNGRQNRRIVVPRNLEITSEIEDRLREWLYRLSPSGENRLQIRSMDLNVIITLNEKQIIGGSYQSSMPPEVHDPGDNYLWRRLEEKSRQLRNPNFLGVRCVFIADTGSTLLRRNGRHANERSGVSAKQIIEEFLCKENAGIDVVAILSPRRRGGIFSNAQTLRWETDSYCRSGLHLDMSNLRRIAANLPNPRLEGYQARSWHEQQAFRHDAIGDYVSSSLSYNGDKMTAKFSARAFHDLLARRISLEKFQTFTDVSDVFESQLAEGRTISTMRFEPGGIDEDDDYIVVEFSDDAAARKLKPSGS